MDAKAKLAALTAARAKLDAEIAELLTAAREELASVAGLTERERALILNAPLTAGEHKHTVNSSMMTAVHKVAISAGRKKKDAFLQAIRAKGYTLRGLAAKLDIPPSLLSMYRSGDRPIPADRAEQVEALTGWKAARANWPGGIA